MTGWTKERIAGLRRVCEAVPDRLRVVWAKDAVYELREDDQNTCLLYKACPNTKIKDSAYIVFRFIASARTALPAALDEIERCHALLARIRQHTHRLPPDIEAELGEGE